MKKYSVVTVLWDDHIEVSRDTVPKNPDDYIVPVLSVGLLLEETDKAIVLVSGIERYAERDDVSYLIILKACILSIKKFGNLKINPPRK